MLTANTVATILLIGSAQGLLLAIVLSTIKRGNRIANRFLAAMLVLFSLNIFLHTISHNKQPINLPHHSGAGILLFFLFGPLFYLYAKALTEKPFRSTNKSLLHFLPFGVIAALYLLFSLLSSKTNAIHDSLAGLVILHVFIYIFATIQLLREHSRNLKNAFSSIEKINLDWLRFLMSGYGLTWVVALIMEGYGKTTATWDVVWILVSVFMYLIGYMGLRQPAIFSGDFEQVSGSEKTPVEKYKKSTLTTAMAETFLKRLLRVMAEEKPYLQNNLTLPLLAKKLSISTHHLSQVINEKLQ